ncbi:uncharacterized protein BT62DRAFT_1011712 [Guyanagaster necrorhizus]|uniref:Uncharacterized protein n=1 Tax=Guyanagaster necrorhizus TaxID=856835 RepID=A0A9P7VJS9_9AGAR|nr:uncharacterized protein BT62DRAFT_1011712 [Guyanagaster necrorhizus MCA 3950]KAG7441296.1 hypothetical protein BT62DRAFT_1011712 [Guyanagaster necrorhizus MCA 3950]
MVWLQPIAEIHKQKIKEYKMGDKVAMDYFDELERLAKLAGIWDDMANDG